MKKLKNNEFVGNNGHFHNEIDLASSEGLDGMKVDNIKPRGPFACPAGHGVTRAGVKPARTMSTSCRKSSTRKWRNFTFQQVLISKGEYDEFGPTIVHRKCFLARRVGCKHFGATVLYGDWYSL